MSTQWSAADREERFREIIRHLDSGQPYDYAPAPMKPPVNWCTDCRMRNHVHAIVRVPPFSICRCLLCPVIVVEVIE